MRNLLRLGYLLPVVLILIWGLVVIIHGEDTLREKTFTLLMFVGMASSLNILLGYTGYVSFGHIVFFGLGGYFGFYLLAQHDWSLIPASLAGGAMSAVIAGLLGVAVLRLRGAYFALATIGINEAARAFVTNFGPFGGATGLYVNFSVYEAYGGASQALWSTFTCLWITALATIIASALVKGSRFGLGLMAIREDEDAAMVMGVKAPQAKTLAFMISAFFPGLIGTLYFFKNGNVEPGDAFHLHMSIELLVMVMLGGQGTVFGPMLGAVTYEGLRGYLLTSPLFKSLHLAVSGLFLLIIVLFVPAGVVGWIRHRLPITRRLLE
ncbi:MAG: branched-chain amino acid ABC transporter permease [Deltaproteobacteria bacterium]|nr:branched-chain amino acid ABC transporter permease [Deltaproteobacteria bacterium]